jgi:hypothetical protein
MGGGPVRSASALTWTAWSSSRRAARRPPGRWIGRRRVCPRRRGQERSRGAPYPRATRTTSSCSTCSSASGLRSFYSLSLSSFLPIFSISFIFFWDTYVPTGMLWEGSSHRLRWISSHQHLIPKRRSGPDFLLKVQSTLLPTSHVIFGGRTTALWSSGQHYTISTRLELLLFAASCILCETNLFLCVII